VTGTLYRLGKDREKLHLDSIADFEAREDAIVLDDAASRPVPPLSRILDPRVARSD
jgi:hypothetical protein